MRQAAGEQATSALLAANSELQARHRELNSARFAVVDVLIRRRSAYSQLATSAARRSGGVQVPKIELLVWLLQFRL
uniref:Uncharacterized protein n=1 Tax=Desertifilum tharense IPPAS B-1220 TaxID=1781255 RepID=A0ACD5GX91_9CYAN